MHILMQYWSGFNREIANNLQYYGFFPMMTMAIRPLSETLTLLPATPEAEGNSPERRANPNLDAGESAGSARAGPSFQLDPATQLLPFETSPTYIWELLAQAAARLTKLVTVRTPLS
jgi:hypothetical protein